MEEKPKYLYRGITINYELFKQININGDILKPHYEPIIDEYGKKVVEDGNEYGLYMTDNLLMARQAYGNPRDYGTNIRPDLRLADNVGRPKYLSTPMIGVIYKIDTNGIDVRKPIICEQLEEHYNNGFKGDEWITDCVPSQNYSIIEIVVGSDLLHDKQKIDVSNYLEAEIQVKEVVEKRKMQLEVLGKELEKLSMLKRMRLTEQHFQLYKDLFGDDGVYFININDIKIDNAIDYIKYLLSIFYCRNKEQLDYETLFYIESLKSKVNSTDSIDKLLEIISNDILVTFEKKERYISNMIKENEEVNTTNFDRKINLYNNVFNCLKKKLNYQERKII